MKYSRTISIFLLIVIGICIYVSVFITNREGLTGDEQIASEKAEDIKQNRELPSVQLWKDASKDAQDTLTAPRKNRAIEYATDVRQAYTDMNEHYETAQREYEEIILPKYESEPSSVSLQQSKQKVEESIRTMGLYLQKTGILADNSMKAANAFGTVTSPSPETTAPTSAPTTAPTSAPTSAATSAASAATRRQKRPVQWDTISATPNSEFRKNRFKESGSNEEPNSEFRKKRFTEHQPNTAPLNTGTGNAIERLNKMTPYEQWDSVNKYYGFEALNEKIDDRILTEKDDGFAKFAANITPPIELTGIKSKDDIVVYDTFIDYLKHLFTTYSEAFTSMVNISDENDNVYELPVYHEVYYKNGELQIAKHDDTDYKGFLEEITLKREELEKEKDVKCNDTIKCIADFDTRIGDKLCCGQKGRLRDTKYVCPENKPTCGNFKCGSKYGECS